jgi:hypothetical protein
MTGQECAEDEEIMGALDMGEELIAAGLRDATQNEQLEYLREHHPGFIDGYIFPSDFGMPEE